MNEIVETIGGKPIEVLTDGLIIGDAVAVTMDKTNPEIHWAGAKLPKKLYLQTVAFAKYCYDKYGGEVQGRLFFHEELQRWKVIVLPQYISRTLASHEIEDHPLRESIINSVGEGYVQHGTWHSHASAGAFQSDTDKYDECKQAGLHYTVGHMDKEVADLDVRYTLRKHFYALEAKDIMACTVAIIDRCRKFPHQWAGALFERPKTMVTSPRGITQTRNRYTSHHQTGNNPYGFSHGSRAMDEKWFEEYQTKLKSMEAHHNVVDNQTEMSAKPEYIRAMCGEYGETESVMVAFFALFEQITGCDMESADDIEYIHDSFARIYECLETEFKTAEYEAINGNIDSLPEEALILQNYEAEYMGANID